MQKKGIYIILLFIFVNACKNEPILDINLGSPAFSVSPQKLISTNSEIEDFEDENIGEGYDENIVVGTFLGNETRNYYGDSASNSLNVVWKTYLGAGSTRINSKDSLKIWKGSGWTGQPLIMLEDDNPVLFQGCYDHTLKKINSLTGEIIWSYKYDDVIKGTGSIYKNDSSQYSILQGSRLGTSNSLRSNKVYSYRSVNAFSGKENWRMNVKRGPSYSRDVDGSALILDDTAYLGLENGYFVVFDPNQSKKTTVDGLVYNEPKIIEEHSLFDKNDKKAHYGNLVTESSPCKLRNHVYISSGSGHIYGYNLLSDSIDWDLEIGSDIDGSPVVTNDSCILVPIEKQYINGHGGVLKIDPSKSPDKSVVWFQPSGDRLYADWRGGVIGSPSTNALYNKDNEYPNIVSFIGIDGFLYVVENEKFGDSLVEGPNQINKYKTPLLIDKIKVGPSISTPIIVGNKIIAAGYKGIYLFEFNKNREVIQKDFFKGNFESTPVVNKGNIFIGSRNGYLYCFGDSKKTNKEQEKLYTDVVNENNRVSPESLVIHENNEVLQIEKQKVTSKESVIEVANNNSQKIYYLVVGTYSIESNAEKQYSVIMQETKGTSGVLKIGKMNYVYSHKSNNKSLLKLKLEKVRDFCNCDAWITAI